MDLSQTLQQLYEYNYWANDRILLPAEGLLDEQLFQPQGHSWGSVYGILFHMMNAEWIWLQRWLGNSPKGFLARDDYPSLPAIRHRWRALETQMCAFVKAQTPDTLLAEVGYTNTRGENFHLPLWQLMLHVPNHNTHHRGELAAIYALMGVEHAEEDWLHYFLQKSGQR